MQLSFQGIEPVTQPGIVNVASVSQLSPFRYPGGKTWLVPFVVGWVRALPERPRVLVDPFLGGGSVPLSILHEGLSEKLVLREIDEEVSSVWQCIFGGHHEALCRKILSFEISRKAVIRELQKRTSAIPDRAFRTILKNRTYRGGILARGASLMKAGENGRGVESRWYPETLVRRIRSVAEWRGAVDFQCGQGFEAIQALARDPRAAFFIDPPYTAGNGKRAGKRLYTHNQLDHVELFKLMAGCAGPFLMTYDDDSSVRALAKRFGFYIARVPMKNAHHEEKFELAISRNPSAVSK